MEGVGTGWSLGPHLNCQGRGVGWGREAAPLEEQGVHLRRGSLTWRRQRPSLKVGGSPRRGGALTWGWGAEASSVPRGAYLQRGALPETPGLTWGAGLGGGRRGKGAVLAGGAGARGAAQPGRCGPHLAWARGGPVRRGGLAWEWGALLVGAVPPGPGSQPPRLVYTETSCCRRCGGRGRGPASGPGGRRGQSARRMQMRGRVTQRPAQARAALPPALGSGRPGNAAAARNPACRPRRPVRWRVWPPAVLEGAGSAVLDLARG